MHQYNEPLLGCALNLRDFPDSTSEVEAYLDRVIVGRKTPVVRTTVVPEPAIVKPVVKPTPAPPSAPPASKQKESPWWDVVVNPKQAIPNNDDRLERLRQYYFKHLRVLTPPVIDKLRTETEEYRQGLPARLDASLAQFASADTRTQNLVLGKLRPLYSQELNDIDDQYVIDAATGDKMLGDFKEQLFRDVPLLQAVQADAQAFGAVDLAAIDANAAIGDGQDQRTGDGAFDLDVVGDFLGSRQYLPEEFYLARTERATAAWVALPAEEEADQLPHGVEAEATWHYRVTLEMTAKEPQIGVDIEFSDDLALTVLAASIADMGDAIDH
jgi:hypothetical protein